MGKIFLYEKEGRSERVKKILVIGSLNMDMVIEMKRMPIVGETVLGTKMTYVPGGKGANQAYADWIGIPFAWILPRDAAGFW